MKEAQQYLQRGWSIIPIQKGSKLPAIKSWMKYQTELPTEADVKNWWDTFTDANIAVICGEVSGLIVVDVDVKTGGLETAKTLHLPITTVAKTPSGGNHYFYKWRKGLVGAKVGIHPGIDIRSDNSYVVISPSKLPNGDYEWQTDENTDIADAPDWLMEKEQQKPATDWNTFLNDKKFWGVQNMSATQVAGKIMYEMSVEMWEPLGFPAFQSWNKNINIPPLPEKELLTIWNSIKKTHLKNNPPVVEIRKNIDEEGIVSVFKKNNKKGTFMLAKYITEKFDIITVGEKEREMFVYQDGVYFQAENEVIYPEIQNILGEEVNRSAKSETFSKICDMTHKSRSIFSIAPLQFIPLTNGVYNFETKELLPHSSEYKFKYKFPVSYSKEATCPKTLAFFEQVLSEEQMQTVQEWIGYYFYRSYMFKKAIIFVGEGDTGKTTLLEVVTYLLGRANISSVPLQKMTVDKFSAAHLYEKHGNLVDELSAKDISDTGAFKMATGGGTITGEYKFGNQFSFHNFSKFTFACNKIPDVKDFEDDAYFGRWIVVRFENKIEKIIPNFIATLTTEEERAGVFNWAMQGLERLLQQGKFTYTNDANDTKMEMMRSSSSAGEFIAKCITQQKGAEITKEDMYDVYSAFCTENGLAIATKKAFGMKFVTLKYVSDGLMYDGGKKRVEGWRNVAVIKSEKQIAEKVTAEKAFKDF